MGYRDKEASHLSRQISSLVRKLRKEANVKQVDFVQRLAMTISAYAPVELGYKEWHMYKIQKLCDIFGLTIGEFFSQVQNIEPVKTRHSK
jgi:transcriptional regulator with XRE-family HTH domain